VNRIAVVGASGFVGSALCERLFFEEIAFTPFVHGTSSVGRISRLGIPIRKLDVLNCAAILDELAGYDVVVNCALGDKNAATKGFGNLLLAAEKLRPNKFIHLSSTAIYGSEPKADCVTESGRPNPQSMEYAEWKLRQDESAFRLNRKGVATYILCPTNVVGPYSLFTISIAEALRTGPVPLVDGGVNPSNLVHVDNLVEAIIAAARSSTGAGERYFVNETRPVSWRQVWEDHAHILGITPEFVPISSEQVRPFLPVRRRRSGIKEQGRLLISPEVRHAVSKIPAVGWMNALASNTFRALSQDTQERIREKLQWPISVVRPSSGLSFSNRVVTAQIRPHYHSTKKLATQLGWNPPLSYEAGLQTIAEWFKFVGWQAVE